MSEPITVTFIGGSLDGQSIVSYKTNDYPPEIRVAVLSPTPASLIPDNDKVSKLGGKIEYEIYLRNHKNHFIYNYSHKYSIEPPAI